MSNRRTRRRVVIFLIVSAAIATAGGIGTCVVGLVRLSNESKQFVRDNIAAALNPQALNPQQFQALSADSSKIEFGEPTDVRISGWEFFSEYLELTAGNTGWLDGGKGRVIVQTTRGEFIIYVEVERRGRQSPYQFTKIQFRSIDINPLSGSGD